MAKTKLTPADEKFIAKFFGKINFDKATITRSNRFTGEDFDVDPICAAAIDFVFKIEGIIGNDRLLKQIHPELKASNAVSNFDRARMLVLKLNSNAYMGILD
jgi:hypothetical protein